MSYVRSYIPKCWDGECYVDYKLFKYTILLTHFSTLLSELVCVWLP